MPGSEEQRCRQAFDMKWKERLLSFFFLGVHSRLMNYRVNGVIKLLCWRMMNGSTRTVRKGESVSSCYICAHW